MLLLIMAMLNACSLSDKSEDPAGPEYSFLGDDGVFLINEGNFMSGNGSLSFYSFKSDSIYNDLFEAINGRPLGDIPMSVALKEDLAYIVVNNSGKIEVINRKTLKSVNTFRDLDSPRNVLIVDEHKAYVTSLWSEKIAILDLVNFSISGYIDIRRSSEAIIMVQNKVFVSCWASGDEILVIDPLTDKLTDSVKVGHEPESMVTDKNKKLWVLCSGGYSGQYYPELVTINIQTNEIINEYQFTSKTSYPTSLCINNTEDTLYYIDQGIKRMSVSDVNVPSVYFVPASGRMFYKLSPDLQKGGLFATNVMDYQQKGYLLRINAKGVVIDSARAGIIPSAVCRNKVVK
jgi:DNA-binding beta-propeller fold protein YncE